MSSAEANAQRPLGASLIAGFTLFLFLHLIASFAYPEWIWGAHHLRYAGAGPLIACGALFVALLLPRGRRALVRLADRASRLAERAPLSVPLGAAALLLFLRSRHFLYGDGYHVIAFVETGGGSDLDRAGHLTVVVHRAVFHLLRAIAPGASAEWASIVVSVAAGVGVVLIARRLGALLLSARASRAVLSASLLGSGGVALFFGHVEEYPLVQFVVILYLFLAARFLLGRGGVLAPSAALAAAPLLHTSAFLLVPSWLVLAWHGRRTLAPTATAAALLALAGGWRLWAFLHVEASPYGGAGALLPLVDPDGAYPYTLLAPSHLFFVANEILLLAGGALLLPLLRLAPAAEPREGEPDLGGATDRRPLRAFLWIATIGTLLAPLLIDARMGPRDWDLLALPLFPLLLLLGEHTLARRAAPSPAVALLAIGAMLLHTIPFVAANANRASAGEMVLQMCSRERHYDRPGAMAFRVLGVLLEKAGYADEAGAAYERSVETLGEDRDELNLGLSYFRRGRPKEAIRWLQSALEKNPALPEALWSLGIAYETEHRFADVEATMRRLLRLQPQRADAHLFLATALAKQGRVPEAVEHFERSAALDPDNPLAWNQLGLAYEVLGREQDARRARERAAALPNPPR